MRQFYQTVQEVSDDIAKTLKSLPQRPGIVEVEAALSRIDIVEQEEVSRLDAINKKDKGPDISEEHFLVLKKMQKNLELFRSEEKKRDALTLLAVEWIHSKFDELDKMALLCVPSGSDASVTPSSVRLPTFTDTTKLDIDPSCTMPSSTKEDRRSSELIAKVDSYLKRAKSMVHDNRIAADPNSSGAILLKSPLKSASSIRENTGKLSRIELDGLIEASSKERTWDLNLQNKLMNEIRSLPDSVVMLSNLMTLDLSNNSINCLPKDIGSLTSLTKLDLNSNEIAELPDSIGDLLNLVYLNLGRNSIEELPYTIDKCSSLVELRAEMNRLKGLPEAVGRLQCLEILTVQYNSIKKLPTSMASLSNLKELNVSFNHLESLPDSLCSATKLIKMNVGNNFALLRSLPESIGNLEMLQELDISNNQIKVLPDSFGKLSQLCLLRAEGNPWEEPLEEKTQLGAEAVVQYIADLASKRDVRKPAKSITFKALSLLCSPISGKRKHDHLDY